MADTSVIQDATPHLISLVKWVGGGLAGTVTVLFTTLWKKQAATEEKLTKRAEACETKHSEAEKELRSMSERLGRIEGKSEGIKEGQAAMERIERSAEELHAKVLEAVGKKR